MLDTHVVLWGVEGTRTVGTRAQEALERATELAFSVVSFAEIGAKAAIGKLSVPDDLREQVIQSGLRSLALAPDHGLGVAQLPMHHRDPFDRLLISQARSEGLTVMTGDPRFASDDIELLDAGL